MDKAWLVVLLILPALAGCTESTPIDPSEKTLADDKLEATDDTGVIRGVVVDQAISPIAGATISIESLTLQAESAEDGSFGFSDLPPGTYFLKIEKIGYELVQSSVEVVAGVDLPPVTRVQLQANPSAAPYMQVTNYRANLLCGLAIPSNPVGIGAFGCSLLRPTEDYVPENNAEVKVFAVIPTWFQTEMFWDSTQPAGDSLILDIAHCCDNEDIGDNSSTAGPSPLAAWATKEEIMAHEGGAIVADGIEIRVFPSGNEAFADTTGQRLGVILDQQVEWISTEFYNFIPADGWTFLADGQHPVPM